MSNRTAGAASDPFVRRSLRILLGVGWLLWPVPALLASGPGGPAGAAGGAGSPADAGTPAPDAGPAAEAEAACTETLVDRVQAHYDGVRDLRARFTQVTRSVAFGGGTLGDQMVGGEVLFAKPGRMRWDYRTPEPSLVVSDGKLLWIFDPAAGEAQELPVGEAFLSGAAIQFLLGEGRLTETFHVAAPDCGQGPARLELRPRQPSSYERLELLVDPETGGIEATTVVDLFGNRTDVRFEDVRTNTSPDEALFRFEAPEGVQMLRLPGN